jgi:signal transduction protein with GAF and PtsI domain
MKRQLLNYETLLKVTNAISHSRDPEEVVLMAVESITHALDVKGCTVFLINRDTDELEVAATYGLSDEYINKGPLSALKSITAALSDGPVAIYDVSDDPRMQYPEAAVKEGIASILVVPIIIRDRTIGALRVYTAEPWEFTLDDVNFVQAMAGIVGMAIDIAKYSKGLNKSIEILKTLRDPKTLKSKKRTPYEGVPKSFN